MEGVWSRMRRRDPLGFAAVAAATGIAWARAGAAVPGWLWAAGAVALGIWAWRGRSGRGWKVVAATGLAFAGWAAWREVDAAALETVWGPASGKGVVVEGTVVDVPPMGGSRRRLVLRVARLEWIGGDRVVREPLRLAVWGPFRGIRTGDRIRAEGILTALPPPRNPDEVSPRGYVRSTNGIVGELAVASPHRIRITGTDGWLRALAWASRARERLGDAITRGLPAGSGEGGLLKAIVLGERDEATPESKDAFLRSGGMHVFSVSGLHVGIFGSVAWVLLRALGISRRPAIAVTVGLALGYAFVTGLPASAVRAAIMLTVFLGGFVVRRQPRLLNSLGLAALVILAVDPAQLYAVGFQLSFGVMTMIGVLAGPLRRGAGRWLEPDPFLPRPLVPRWRWRVAGVGRYFADLVAVSAAAFVGSFPLLWWHFGTITPAGLVSNCALIPLTWAVMGVAAVSITCWSVGLGFLSAGLNQVNAVLAGLTHGVALVFAGMPGGHFEVTPLSELGAPRTEARSGIVVFDTGKACGPVAVREVEGGTPRTWLIDCGDETGYRRVIRPWVRRHAGDVLEGFVRTHGDKAHGGGQGRLFRDVTVGRVWESGLPDASEVFREARRAREEGWGWPETEAVRAGTRARLGERMALEVVFPPEGYPEQGRADDQCVVVAMSLGPWRILAMTDSGFVTESWLLEHRPDLKADVVVMGRHASDVSGLPEFWAGLGCRVLVATSASFPLEERFPEASRDVARRLGIRVFDQGECGAVEIREEGDELVVSGYLGGTWRGRREQEERGL
jgi:competence protein ComEC